MKIIIIMVIIVIMTEMIICSLTKTPAAVFRLQDLPREVQYQLHLCGRPRDLKMVERKSIIIAIVLCYQVLCANEVSLGRITCSVMSRNWSSSFLVLLKLSDCFELESSSQLSS